MAEVPRYALNPLAPFPKRWRDPLGNIRVMAEPVQGYVMVRRPGAYPFVLCVAHLTNAERHPVHGPFHVVEPAGRSIAETEE